MRVFDDASTASNSMLSMPPSINNCPGSCHLNVTFSKPGPLSLPNFPKTHPRRLSQKLSHHCWMSVEFIRSRCRARPEASSVGSIPTTGGIRFPRCGREAPACGSSRLPRAPWRRDPSGPPGALFPASETKQTDGQLHRAGSTPARQHAPAFIQRKLANSIASLPGYGST